MKVLVRIARQGQRDLRLRVMLAAASPAIMVLASNAAGHWH
ncbi:MAG: hypothetical protein ACRDG4_19275 [Chloroflexota bacterium]